MKAHHLLSTALPLLLATACATTKSAAPPPKAPAPLPSQAPSPSPTPTPTPTPSPTPTPTPSPTPSPTPTPQPSPFSISMVGDIMMGTTFPVEPDYTPAGGPAALMAPVKSLLAADVVFGNLEGPLIDGGETKKCGPGQNCYAFRSPTSYVDVLKDAGFTVMSVANNHALDFGDEGRKSTMDTLDAKGILWAGPPGQAAIFEAGGQPVALAAFSTAEHSNDMRNIPAAVELVSKLSETHEIVIVSFHGGSEGRKALHMTGDDEYLGREYRGNPQKFARAVIDAGADLVIGHGPHVLRALEVYKGRLVTYSLGNFFTYGRFSLRGASGQAVVLKATLGPDGRFIEGRADAVIQKKPGGPKPDPSGAGIKLLQDLTKADIKVPGITIENDGTLRPAP